MNTNLLSLYLCLSSPFPLLPYKKRLYGVFPLSFVALLLLRHTDHMFMIQAGAFTQSLQRASSISLITSSHSHFLTPCRISLSMEAVRAGCISYESNTGDAAQMTSASLADGRDQSGV